MWYKIKHCLVLSSLTLSQGVSGPVMTANNECQYEILWETEFACPVNTTLQNNTGCIIRNEFVNFDLSPLAAPALSNYMVNVTDRRGTTYLYYINVCKSTNIPCTPSGTEVLCQLSRVGEILICLA